MVLVVVILISRDVDVVVSDFRPAAFVSGITSAHQIS
jgi:hypothetical protein